MVVCSDTNTMKKIYEGPPGPEEIFVQSVWITEYNPKSGFQFPL